MNLFPFAGPSAFFSDVVDYRFRIRPASVARVPALKLRLPSKSASTLTESSDDPDYASALARILIKAGRANEAEAWRSKAAAGYDDLLNRHYDAFADHAAAFLLERGGDPHRALALAQRNLEIRRTPRSLNVYERARLACSDARNAEGYNRA